MGNCLFNEPQGTIGHYSIIKTIGYGTSCKVKLAVNNNTGSKVALKILNNNISNELMGRV